MKLPELIAGLEFHIENPAGGLPEDVFRLVSRLTPLVNVDLLIRNERGQTLLTWRHDDFYGPGWHVPGGIVRFKEKFADRIAAVAANEIGAGVSHDDAPLAIHEIVSPTRSTRGHFLSILYACTLTAPPDPARAAAGTDVAHGQWAWHERAPADLIAVYEIYRRFIDGACRA